MELNLKIYDDNDKRKVVKTYRAETFDMSFGVIEDTLEALDFEKLDINDKKAMSAAVFKGSKCIRKLQ